MKCKPKYPYEFIAEDGFRSIKVPVHPAEPWIYERNENGMVFLERFGIVIVMYDDEFQQRWKLMHRKNQEGE